MTKLIPWCGWCEHWWIEDPYDRAELCADCDIESSLFHSHPIPWQEVLDNDS
jgi:hypothetical protein